jgi:hypothetical protein
MIGAQGQHTRRFHQQIRQAAEQEPLVEPSERRLNKWLLRAFIKM